MKNLFILFTVFSIISCQKKEVSPEIINIIKPIQNYTFFYALDTIPSIVYKKLKNAATDEQLETLILKENNPYVKAVAIEALIEKNNNYVFELFEKNLNSKDSIIYRTECLRGKSSIPGYIFSIASFPRDNISAEQANINKERLIEILFSQDELNVKLVDEFILWIPNSEEYYFKIREAIIESRSKYLLRALAKFRKKQDIALIKSFGKDAFAAIGEFPDSEFLDMFEKYKSVENTFDYKYAENRYRK